jgi:ligand-binding sensor domain-containing protein
LCIEALRTQPINYFWSNDVIHLSKEKGNYQTKIFGTQNGLPSSEITCLAQDSKGFLWVGTSAGLSRFDGNQFKSFLKAGNYFTGKNYSIKEDILRNVLWIACDAGLCYLKNDKLFFVKFHENDVTTYDIYLDKHSNMWVATGKGPAFFTPKIISNILSDSVISLAPLILPQWNDFDQSTKHAYKITCSNKGNLYFSGRGSLYLFSNKKLERIWRSSRNENNNEDVVGLLPGKGDTVFFATTYEGLFGVVKNTIYKIVNDNDVAASLTDQEGQLYYFTAGGIYKFYSKGNHLKKISEVPENVNLWPSCVLVDNENNLWIGMGNNLLYQKPRIFYTYNNGTNDITPELYSACQLKNTDLLFGSNRGKIYIKDGSFLKNYLSANGRAVSLSEIKAMYEDGRGWLWMGSVYQGISILKNNRIIHLAQADGLSSNSNYFFYEDSNYNIYTGGDGGFSKINYDPVTDKFLFKNFFFNVAGENVETFKSCIGGPDGALWLVGQEGIFHFKNDTLTRYEINGLINLSASDIKKDASGKVWITTKGDGIWQCFFDEKNLLKVNKILTEKDGLQSNIYLSLAIDSKNNVWAAGYGGITSIKGNSQNFKILNYSAGDGFLSSNYQSVRLLHAADDTVWVVTSAGLTSFYAGDFKMDKKLLLNFTDIFLLDTAYKISSVSKNGFYSGIALPYYSDGIEFQYKAVCLSDPQRIRYSYRMLGLKDTAWLDWVDKEIAIYQNLSPGKYTFQVKALLNNSIESNVITVSFIIKKPFWLLWWFISLTALIIVIIFYLIIKKWKKNIHTKNEERIKTQQLISDTLQYRLEVEQVTNYFANSISASETEDDLLWDVARQCISQLNFEDCVIYLKDKKTNNLVQKAAWGPKSILNGANEMYQGKIVSPLEIPIDSGIVGHVATTGVAEIVPDVTKDIRYIVDDAQRNSEITVPIIYDNKVLGVIDSESVKTNFYTQRHLQILTSIASHCAERIVKLRADKKLEKKIKFSYY